MNRPLEAQAEFAHLLHGGEALSAPLEPDSAAAEFIGLPGLLTPEQMAGQLGARDSFPRRTASKVAARTGRRLAKFHLDLRTAVPDPSSAAASIDVVMRRRDHLLASS